MHFPPDQIPPSILLGAFFLWMLTLLVAVRASDWAALCAAPGRVHLIAGGAVACLLLWLLNIQLVDGLRLHFFGMTTLTLVVGWPFAVLGGSLAIMAFSLLLALPSDAWGLAALFTVILPATLSRLLAWLIFRPDLKNPFVYILGAGFAGGALVAGVLGLLAIPMFLVTGDGNLLDNALQGWPLIFLIMFSEGFINGMCIAALAVFHPDALKTFDDRFYFGDP